MSVHIIVKGDEYEMPSRFAKLSKFLQNKLKTDEVIKSGKIEINNISSKSFEICKDFCECYMGIETKDQEAMQKDITVFMSNDKYSHYADQIRDLFDIDYELLFDTMNTAELLNISPLTCVLSYYLFALTKKKKTDIANLLK